MEGIKNRNNSSKIVLIISASSDIGISLCEHWRNKQCTVAGSYRNKTSAVERLICKGVDFVHGDLLNPESIKSIISFFQTNYSKWDLLIFTSGTLEPTELFEECNFHQWQDSIIVNFSSQMEILHGLLPYRNRKGKNGSSVIFFAGSGTNSNPTYSSAYSVSKIALIKMCELLDAEITDCRFTIIGPGWVKTKIHNSILKAGSKLGVVYQRVVEKIETEEYTSMDSILECCDWVESMPREIVGGRNFSVVFDKWGSEELIQLLKNNNELYKLRRFGNDLLT